MPVEKPSLSLSAPRVVRLLTGLSKLRSPINSVTANKAVWDESAPPELRATCATAIRLDSQFARDGMDFLGLADLAAEQIDSLREQLDLICEGLGLKRGEHGMINGAILDQITMISRLTIDLEAILTALEIPPTEIGTGARAAQKIQSMKIETEKRAQAFPDILVGRPVVLSNAVDDIQRDKVAAANFAIVTDMGVVRKHNEDDGAFLILEDGTKIFVVSDGVGGHGNGEVASQIAVNTYLKARLKGKTPVEAVLAANQAIYDETIRDTKKKGMGATLAVLEVDEANNRLVIINVGDSRVKMVDENDARILTEDHKKRCLAFIELESAIYQNGITDEQIERYENWELPAELKDVPYLQDYVITAGLGLRDSVPAEMNVITIPIEKKSSGYTTILLYSDGAVDGEAEEWMLTDIARKATTPEGVAYRCVQNALQNRSADNVTVAAARIPYRLVLEQLKIERYTGVTERDASGNDIIVLKPKGTS